MGLKINNNLYILLLSVLIYTPTLLIAQFNSISKQDVLHVKSTTDFIVTGNGTAANWEQAEWNLITQRHSKTLQKSNWSITQERINIEDTQYETYFKILYSSKGIYCLYKCEDSVITATLKEDYLNLYDEDVVEAFFWPDTTLPVYFEYELSPLNYELPLLILNHNGNITGWKPWQFEGAKKTIHAISNNNKIIKNQHFNWTAEFFIPYTLLGTMIKMQPKKGTQWRANFYRIDYDHKPVYSSWQLTRKGFHDPQKFGILQFE